ncbi:MAG: AMP-binding protein [Burkholderiales bacterium]
MSYVSNLSIAFRYVAEKFPERVALHYPETGHKVTYADLARHVDHACQALALAGLRRGDVVAIFSDKSPLALASVLACLRLGLPYAHLDPDSPWARLEKILRTCNPSAVLNFVEALPIASELAAYAGAKLHAPTQWTKASAAPAELPPFEEIDGATPAYIMFTSGSTGNPKGAVMSHANVLQFISWAQSRFSISHQDVRTSVNPIYFDNSVFDFYSAFFSGATLVPLTAAQVREPRLLVRLVSEAKCSIWFSVPSMLVYLLTTRALTSSDLPAIRKIIFGGEGFPKTKLRQLFGLFAARADLENVYGPTECTCICSAHTVTPSDFEDMQNLTTLGKLAQNFDYEIIPLDGSDSNVGELFLRGPQVGLGYYNDVERSAKSFIQNPTHTRYRDIGYRTGDIVARDGNGNLHFKGRVDFQIKHMGYRIELEEIEAGINTITHIKECGVVYSSTGGFGQIVAFASSEVPLDSAETIEKIAKLLPPYMVPRQLRFLDALPKNANGKIDRVALKALV